MKHCAAVVGNSSSGIIEAPAFPVPTVNIGDRQKGRLRTNSIIDCGPGRAEITAAIRRAIGPEFGKAVCTAQSPYGCGGTAERITTILKEIDLDGILLKTFYDLPIVP